MNYFLFFLHNSLHNVDTSFSVYQGILGGKYLRMRAWQTSVIKETEIHSNSTWCMFEAKKQVHTFWFFTSVEGQLSKGPGQGALCQPSPLLSLKIAKTSLIIIFLLIFSLMPPNSIFYSLCARVYLFTHYKVIHVQYKNIEKNMKGFIIPLSGDNCY